MAVVDASVAVKWVVDEPHSEAPAALLDRPIAWLAPRLMLVEAAAAVRRKVSDRELNAVTGTAALRSPGDATREGTIRLADDEQLVTEAFLLAVELGHKVPTCMAFWVPALPVTHYITFIVLLRDREPS